MINLSWSSIEFIHPMWLWLLPLPLLVTRIAPSYRTQQSAIKVPFFHILTEALEISVSDDASRLTPAKWQRILLSLSWLMILIALTKPTLLGPPQTREQFGRDVMVVVDLSGSMAEKDFTSTDGVKISRLDAVKKVLNDFAKTRKGDRLGLILFGDAAFVQTPFTADHDVWLDLLNQTRVEMAGKSTHLGDAIGLTIKRFEENDNSRSININSREKVAIILTDGNDTDSYVPPVDAAKVAKVKGVRIHMIAIGDPQTVGEQALDMDTINTIADASGGQAFQALNQDELINAYAEISKLEPQLYQSTTYRTKQSIHQYPVMVMLLIHLFFFGFMSCKYAWKKAFHSKGEHHV
ncbi:VWA domain-containing protein [Aliivibrio fischeri]|uniref:VWA domain-containing protein n=1 Tax=Aliivibrio fischeri TaxID=668 RepID=A0A6N3YWZ5_ALIFS|nr:VWA domain-containing protein [Aliivibrio fischeri]MUK44938.1 VWA domain-containing protein [Aliivibrio fischeri]MUK80597.1 VWA domain-containing protein [Aliivibrio fischeri]MUK84394.1 VWA domain-containing protein [Aliivibrio fischeri]